VSPFNSGNHKIPLFTFAILVKNRNFGQTLRQESQFWSKITFLINNFCQNFVKSLTIYHLRVNYIHICSSVLLFCNDAHPLVRALLAKIQNNHKTVTFWNITKLFLSYLIHINDQLYIYLSGRDLHVLRNYMASEITHPKTNVSCQLGKKLEVFFVSPDYNFIVYFVFVFICIIVFISLLKFP